MQTQLATRIDTRLKKTIDALCKERGVKIGKFVEDALYEKLEEMEDIAELSSLRREPSRALDDVLKDLKAHGKL